MLPIRIRKESQRPSDPKSGGLLVWHFFEMDGIHNFHLYEVASPEEARVAINQLAQEQVNDESVGYNAFGLEVFEENEWVEWYDDNGNDTDDFMKERDS